MRKLTLGSIVTATLLLIGCGGGGSTSSDDTTTALSPTTTATSTPTINSSKTVGTGYYVDSAVEGIDYSCGSETGVTDSNGTFTFENGQNCKFVLGDITLREINASMLEDNITILEDNITVAQLLQTLDADGNATNGIQILDGTDRVVRDEIQSLNGLDSDVLDAIHSSMRAEHQNEYNGTVIDINKTKAHILETEARLEDEGRITQHSSHRDNISTEGNSTITTFNHNGNGNSHTTTEIEHNGTIVDNNSTMEQNRDGQNNGYMNGVNQENNESSSSTNLIKSPMSQGNESTSSSNGSQSSESTSGSNSSQSSESTSSSNGSESTSSSNNRGSIFNRR
jgi:hypothetical protein